MPFTPRFVLVVALAVGLTTPLSANAQEVEPLASLEPTAVVSFTDTGINPYHTTFRDSSPRAYQHPSTYIPGYPEDAIALPITLDEPDWAIAVKADCDLWSSVEPQQLYWFPGTKIVGAISFKPPVNGNCSSLTNGGTEILDDPDTQGFAHGTMVASRGASIEYGACKDCRIVSVQFVGAVQLASPKKSTAETTAAVNWSRDNAGWIDAESNSWGPIVPGWDPTGETGILVTNPELARSVEQASAAHPAFWASGNGAAFRGGVLGHPTLLSPHLGPSAIIVGGHDSGYVNVWPGFPPHLVSDSCDAWAAKANSTTDSGERISGGTSGATPFVAGGATKILLEARRILGDLTTGVGEGGVMATGPAGLVPSGPIADGVFSKDELRTLTFQTATARPAAQFEDGPPCALTAGFDPTPIKWVDVPPQYPEFLHIGYGAVDGPAMSLAFQVLRGEASLPDRSRTDQYFALDATARAATYQVFDGLP